MACRILNHFLELVSDHAYFTDLLSQGPSVAGIALLYITDSARRTSSVSQKIKAAIALLEMFQLTNPGMPGLAPSTVYPTLRSIIQLLPEVLGSAPIPADCDDNLLGQYRDDQRVTDLLANLESRPINETYGIIVTLLEELLQ